MRNHLLVAMSVVFLIGCASSDPVEVAENNELAEDFNVNTGNSQWLHFREEPCNLEFIYPPGYQAKLRTWTASGVSCATLSNDDNYKDISPVIIRVDKKSADANDLAWDAAVRIIPKVDYKFSVDNGWAFLRRVPETNTDIYNNATLPDTYYLSSPVSNWSFILELGDDDISGYMLNTMLNNFRISKTYQE